MRAHARSGRVFLGDYANWKRGKVEKYSCVSVIYAHPSWLFQGHGAMRAVLELLARGQLVTAELASKVNVANSVSVGKPGSMYSQAAATRWITRRA
ncbi:hypothetical protein [Nitrosospira multiformis]|nr:hypothetical protein [Nitrosospira multiformis]